MRCLLGDARDVLEEAKFTHGTGSNELFGIETALGANTNVEVGMASAARTSSRTCTRRSKRSPRG